MNQGKMVAFVIKPRMTPANEIWGQGPGWDNKFVLEATIVVDKSRATPGQMQHRTFTYGEPVRTSLLVRVDLEKQEFETLNTIYQVIPEDQVDVYRMCVPT